MFSIKQQMKLPDRIVVGVSSCLLGNAVRFDGGHKHNRFITGDLADYFEFRAFCPEMAIGLGTPRQPIRLVGDVDRPQAIGVKDGQLNVTRRLRDYGRWVSGEIGDLCGFILKKDSPSCGMERVRVYGDKGSPVRGGTGLFARELMNAHPLLPIEEEGRLNDAALRENFIMRVYVFARWKALRAEGITKSALIRFHAAHKLLVMAHSNVAYRELGQLLANLAGGDTGRIADRYVALLMRALSRPADRKRHANVLQHLMGYLRTRTDKGDRAELAEVIDGYRRGLYPLVVPLGLLGHHFRRSPNPYISQQVYLEPYPAGMMLRNQV